MKYQFKNKTKKGFTLIELLVAMAILGILATVGMVSFRMAQVRGRDVQRKSDLKQISNALELYYSDHKVYPQVVPEAGGTFTDGNTTYLMEMPADPAGGNYDYQVTESGNKFRLFSHLENPEDKNLIEVTVSSDCGGEDYICNFSITSANTTANEDWDI